MKVGIIGSGGREHAICESLKKSSKLIPILRPSISKSLISSALVNDWKLNVKIRISSNLFIINAFSMCNMCVKIYDWLFINIRN